MSDYRNLFANQTAPARTEQGSTAELAKNLFPENTPRPTPAVSSSPDNVVPSAIATPHSVQQRYTELAGEHEKLVHRILDLTQSVKQREQHLDSQFKHAQKQAQALQNIMTPKRRFFSGKVEIDKKQAHQLVDELQSFMRQELKPDLFLYKDIDLLAEQAEYLERLVNILRSDAQQVLTANDSLLERIATQTHLLSLQAKSTLQLKQQLTQQLQDIEQWRQQFLSLLVIDIQQKL